MAFKPGTPKPPNSGRQKGTLNKTTQNFQELIEKAFDNNLPGSLAEDIKLIHSPLERAKLKLALIEFIYPKRKALEVSSDVALNVTTQEELDKHTDEFIDKLADINRGSK